MRAVLTPVVGARTNRKQRLEPQYTRNALQYSGYAPADFFSSIPVRRAANDVHTSVIFVIRFRSTRPLRFNISAPVRNRFANIRANTRVYVI
jgi:hypothetical protein